MGSASRNLREELIEAGIREIDKNGIQGFSVRRVASECGVSCATPYKYFENRNGFIAGIIEYINSIWAKRQEEVLSQVKNNTRKQLLAVSMEYVKFLVENPHFRSIIMLKDEGLDAQFSGIRGPVSKTTQRLIDKYCKEVNMPEKVVRLKTYVVRSLIYGAALMFDNEEIEYNEDNLELVAYAIDREFELD